MLLPKTICLLCPVPLRINQLQLKYVSLTLLSYLSLPRVYDPNAAFTLRCLPLALVCWSTTGGSLTYIGSYISGAKSTPQTLLENSQVSSGTWAMSWMFGHKGVGRGGIASLRLYPSSFQMKIATILLLCSCDAQKEGNEIDFYKCCAGFCFFNFVHRNHSNDATTLKTTLIDLFCIVCFIAFIFIACFVRRPAPSFCW